MKILKEEIKIYSSSKELPIGRYSEFESEYSRDLDIPSSLDRLKAFYEEGLHDEFITEIERVRENLKSGINVYSRCFAILVHSINGEIMDDMSSEGLDRCVKMLEKYEI